MVCTWLQPEVLTPSTSAPAEPLCNWKPTETFGPEIEKSIPSPVLRS
ncbi:hypothetical protein FHW23_002820 [Curtobacterium pusillum]|uniref:Uncharacterized protein n=1 Tax=Curtobacterium pusillum TaxID=69373 RepID=A0AAW3T8U3_9MICO|nr:hypothetical protein [Curtobacterium pusillum]